MEKIKLIKSSFFNEEKTKKELCDFVRCAEFLSMGKECKRFEDSFSKFQGRKYSVFVNSGSSANLLLIRALLNMGKLKKGDRVGVSALTWPTNIMPLIEMNLKPILVDCELQTLNVSLNKIKGKDLDALFLTNVLGFCSDIDLIREHCFENDILFIEDNCESLGSEYRGKMLGNFGFASTFSFFVGHHLSTIEGGMICTDDKELYESLLISRAHGWSRNLDEEKQKELMKENGIDPFYNKYSFYDLAYNLRPTEINGFIGNSQMRYLKEIITLREGNFKKINNAIKRNHEIYDLLVEEMDVISNFAVPLIFKNDYLAKKYRKEFEQNGVELRPIISGNIQNQPFFKKYCKMDNEEGCKNAELIHKNGFYIGNNPEMTDDEISRIVKLISKAKSVDDKQYDEIAEKIPICTFSVAIFSEDLKSVLLFSEEKFGSEFNLLTGRLFKGEGPEEGILRMLGEEIGIYANRGRLKSSGWIYERGEGIAKKGSFETINLLYCMRVDSKEEREILRKDNLGKWIDVEDIILRSSLKKKVRESLKAIKNGNR